jgi:hypothetical protein
VSYVLTFYFAKLAAGELAAGEIPAGFWVAFYASWVSGLLLFTLVGLIAGLVTLYRPERDVFLARVKILLGGMGGAIVDVVAAEIRKIGYVARQTTRTIIIEEYDQKRNAFKIRVNHVSKVKNILGDAVAEAKGAIRIVGDPFEPPFQPAGEITSFQIVGTEPGPLPLQIQPEGIVKPWSLSVPPLTEGDVAYEHWVWYGADSVHVFNVARFTEELHVEFRSRCLRGIHLKVTTPLEATEYNLTYDGRYKLNSPLRDLSPGSTGYSFQIGINQ